MKNKIKIAIGPQLGEYGGVAQHIKNIAIHSKFKPSVIKINDTLVFSYRKDFFSKKLKAIQRRWSIKYMDLIGLYYSKIKFKKYNIVHLHGHPAWQEFYLKTKGPKYIHTVHQVYEIEDAESDWGRKEREHLNKLMFDSCKKCDAVIAVSTYVQKRLEPEGVKSIVVNNGVNVKECQEADPDLFRRRFNIKRKYIIHPGDNRLVKQPRIFIEIAGAFPEYDFVMIGNGTETEKITKQYNIKPPLNFIGIGKVSHKDALSAYKGAELFILPSKNESFPTSLLEAMACGTLSIAANSGGSSEIITDDINGILFDIDNKDSLPEKVSRAINLRVDDKIKIKASGRERASNFDWPNVTTAIDEIYENLIKNA